MRLTDAQLAEAIGPLSAMWSRAQSLQSENIGAWRTALERYPISIVNRAVERYCAEGKHPPKPGDIVEICRGIAAFNEERGTASDPEQFAEFPASVLAAERCAEAELAAMGHFFQPHQSPPDYAPPERDSDGKPVTYLFDVRYVGFFSARAAVRWAEKQPAFPSMRELFDRVYGQTLHSSRAAVRMSPGQMSRTSTSDRDYGRAA